MQDFTITATTAAEKHINLRIDVNFEYVNHEM